MKISKDTFAGLLVGLFVSCCLSLLSLVLSIHACNAAERIPEQSTQMVTIDFLSEWEVFIMALIEVECERNPTVISDKGAVGPLQITQTYIDEVNRLYRTSFILEEAKDLNKALTIFEMMNDYYNPTRDIDKAIKLHNPGAGKWYSQRIKERIKLIEFNEEVRSQIVELHNLL